MKKSDIDILVSAWIALQRAEEDSEEYNRNSWATEKMWELSQDNPDLSFNIILEILRRDNMNMIVENLAAGPLEDLLCHHGQDVIDRVETQARQSEQFRILLAGVWQNNMTDELWTRVRAAAGKSL